MEYDYLDKRLLDAAWARFYETGAIIDYLVYIGIKEGKYLDATNDNTRRSPESDGLQRER